MRSKSFAFFVLKSYSNVLKINQNALTFYVNCGILIMLGGLFNMIEKIKRTIIGGQNSPFRLCGREYRDSDRRDYRLYNEAKGKIGIFKPLMGYNKKGKLTRHDASDFGELIAYWLARKTDIPVCEVELATKKEQYYSAKSVDVRGAMSYLDLQPGETVALSIEILDYYRRNHFDEYKEILLANKSVREKDLSQYKEAILSEGNSGPAPVDMLAVGARSQERKAQEGAL